MKSSVSMHRISKEDTRLTYLNPIHDHLREGRRELHNLGEGQSFHVHYDDHAADLSAGLDHRRFQAQLHTAEHIGKRHIARVPALCK